MLCVVSLSSVIFACPGFLVAISFSSSSSSSFSNVLLLQWPLKGQLRILVTLCGVGGVVGKSKLSSVVVGCVSLIFIY